MQAMGDVVVVVDAQSLPNDSLHSGIARVPRIRACSRWNVELDHGWWLCRGFADVQLTSKDVVRRLAGR